MSGKIGNISKAAESRQMNTRNEVEFLAKTYYNFLQFCASSGIGNLEMANDQFDGMVSSYIQLGKIKKESYNRFKGYIVNSNMNPLNMTCEDFVKQAVSGFEKSICNTSGDSLRRLEEDFYALLNKYNISMPNVVRQALFISVGLNIADLYQDRTLQEYFEGLANRSGMNKVEWRGPQVMLSPGDGCSGSRPTYGSLWRNLSFIKR